MYIFHSKFVIEEIEKQCGKEVSSLGLDSDSCSILAGGSVANAILNVTKRKAFKINDLDIFEEREPKLDIYADSVVTFEPTDTTYPQNMTRRLRLLDRETQDNVDRIGVNILDAYGFVDVAYTDEKFYSTVLQSFDLNCVQAGIFYEAVTCQYNIIVTDHFINFLVSNKVEIVNVHSWVTFVRAIKKANDLDATLNLAEEVRIVGTACNPENLRDLGQEQIEKHRHLVSIIPVIKTAIRSRTGVYERFYEYFGDFGVYNKREVKIKFLRSYVQGDENQKEWILAIAENGTDRFLDLFLSQKDVLSWIGDTPYSQNSFNTLASFLYRNNYNINFLRNMPLRTAIIRATYLNFKSEYRTPFDFKE